MTTDPRTDLFVPPAAEGLPLAALDSATVGADRLDAAALTPAGRNFLAHALVQLARDGWLRAEPGEGFEAERDRETPEPLPAVVSVPPPADRATLREGIAAALYEHMHPGSYWSDTSMPSDWRPAYLEEADAVLAVLPEQTDRATLLREAAEVVESDSWARRDRWGRYEREEYEAGMRNAAELLGRMADEADAGASRLADEQPAETQDGAEAHPAEHTWAAELHDPLADEWVPGTRYLVRDRAVNALAHAKRLGPTWKDGTPTERRLVRATTTYTVEADADQQTPRPSCPDPIECGHEAALGLAEMRLDKIREKATQWTALAPADDWGDTPQDTALADVGRYLLRLIETITPATTERSAVAEQPAETQDGDRRETIEYFVQSQQPDGTWESASGPADDLAFAGERLAARRRMMPDLVLRLAERTTTVNVRALPGCLTCRHWSCTGTGPCGALLDAWQRCSCPGPAVAEQPDTQTREALTLPPPEGPEYTPCLCSHIEPEHAPNAGDCWTCDCEAYRPAPPAPVRRSEDDCPGFPERCPNLRPVDPQPPVHLGGIRCGCADPAS